jgi:predicted AAA+ superfamily ATPase
MIPRRLEKRIIQRISSNPVVALLGSRQVGKTTLARDLKPGKPIHYLDLERPSDLAKLADPELYLGKFADHLIVLDEIQRLPDIFPVLRSLVDERRRAGENAAQFLLLGSASPDLLRQTSETLAGRISYLEMTPLMLNEVMAADDSMGTMDRHWFRGGYPGSYLAADDPTASQWCDDFVTSYVERYLPQLGVAVSPVILRRLCGMLAHVQGCTVNASKLAASLGIDGKSVRHYMNLLEGLYLLRSLPAWSRNAGKRLVKSPKTYWRDSGLLHALAGLGDIEQVLGHPLCGHSWEGYCIEQILAALPPNVSASHYRTLAGAEVDLVLEYPDGEIHAIEIKRTLSPKLTPAFSESLRTLGATKATYLIPQGETFPLSKDVDAMSLPSFLNTCAI